MAKVSEVKGVKELVTRFHIRNKKFAKGVSIGLRKAGLLIQRDAQLMVPVDTGTLKASAFTRWRGIGFDTMVMTGFDTAYAVFVHESRGVYRGRNIPRRARYKGHRPKGSYWDPKPRGQPKFLGKSVTKNTKAANDLIRVEAWKSFYSE